ncbi:hypothetical protein PROFUN_01616 [Planoprotostelium fungivorum]|uniref:UNC93-like protein MFSD11 n=1 Tax=Planoprotostelium fungivorum TaxID=1890364 RepID=A0A2P6NTR6_9EUKA|nr:hypothetical protein PROFUN_01616 [Planoprotostelium fungivorum]
MEDAEKESVEKKEVAPLSSKIGKVAYLGCSFCILFVAYQLTQGFLTTLFPPNISLISLSIIYISLGLMSLVTPQIQTRIGLRWSFLIGGFTYPLFIFSLVLNQSWFVFMTSFTLGAGASLLWLAQGVSDTLQAVISPIHQVYISLLADGSNVGKFNGIFFSIHNVNMIIGMFTLSVVDYFHVPFDLNNLPMIMTFVGLLSLILFFFVRDVEGEKGKKEIAPFVEGLKELWKISTDTKMLCIYAAIILQGSHLTFTFGPFPTMVDKNQVANLFLVCGVARMSASYVAGKMYDRLGWHYTVAAETLVLLLSYGSSVYGYRTSSFWAMLVASFGFGAGDSFLMLIISASIMSIWKQEAKNPFAMFRLFSSLASGIGMIAVRLFSWEVVLVFNLIMTLCAAGSYCLLFCRVIKKDAMYAQLEMQEPIERE